MAKLAFMQTAGGNFRVRRYENENDDNTGSFTEEYQLTTAQWKAILDVVGVAASTGASEAADTEMPSQAAVPAGKLSATNYS